MKINNQINSQKTSQDSTSEQNKPALVISNAMQYLELEEEEILYSPQVARICIC